MEADEKGWRCERLRDSCLGARWLDAEARSVRVCSPMHVLGWTSLTLWASLLSGVFSLDWLQALPCGFHQTHRDGQHTQHTPPPPHHQQHTCWHTSNDRIPRKRCWICYCCCYCCCSVDFLIGNGNPTLYLTAGVLKSKHVVGRHSFLAVRTFFSVPMLWLKIPVLVGTRYDSYKYRNTNCLHFILVTGLVGQLTNMVSSWSCSSGCDTQLLHN